MDSITTTVTDLWDFLVPPLVKITLVLGVTALIAKPMLAAAINRIATATERLRNDRKTESLLKSLRLEKIITAVIVFIFVFAIYAGNKLILGIGWCLPFDIITIQPISLLHHTTEERLLTLWAQHPDVEFYNLPLVLDNDLHRLSVSHTPDILSNVNHWEKRSAETTRWFYTVKFLILYVILLCIIAILRSWQSKKAIFRTIVLVLALIVALMSITGRRLYCYNQLLQAKYSIIEAAIPNQDNAKKSEEKLKESLNKVEMTYGDNNWWEIRFIDTYSWKQGFKYLGGGSLYQERKKTEQTELSFKRDLLNDCP